MSRGVRIALLGKSVFMMIFLIFYEIHWERRQREFRAEMTPLCEQLGQKFDGIGCSDK